MTLGSNPNSDDAGVSTQLGTQIQAYSAALFGPQSDRRIDRAARLAGIQAAQAATARRVDADR